MSSLEPGTERATGGQTIGILVIKIYKTKSICAQ